MKDALGHGSDPRGALAQGHSKSAPVAVHGGMVRPDGTYDSYGITPTTGYMVGGALHSRYTGEWTDPATGKHYSEKSTHVDSETLARSMGHMRNQISVYDLGRHREIQTGGTGIYTPR